MKVFIGLFFIISFIGCIDDKYVYQKYFDISKALWKVNKNYKFDFIIQDTSRKYDIKINLKHNNTYPYKNMYFFITTYNKVGQFYIDTLNVVLQLNDGLWMGKRVLNTWEYEITYLKGAKFREEGNYTVSVEQAMRDSLGLMGIEKIGLSIIKNKGNK